jgi:hypothetical protein
MVSSKPKDPVRRKAPATIQQIAAEVVARLPYGDRYWLFLLGYMVVAALVGALAALGRTDPRDEA